MSSFLGIHADRLEKVEERLRADIVKEAKGLGGLILVHQELFFEAFQADEYRLKYFRIPISPEQAFEDNYLDEYVRVIKGLEPTDPLIFNCGMGAVRTTIGMVIAQIIRRTQLLERGLSDPFPVLGYNYAGFPGNDSAEAQTIISPELVRGLEGADSMKMQNHALMRVIYVLEQGLNSKMSPRSAIEWTLERGSLIESLKDAIMGNYQCVVSLTSLLDSGTFSKKMLDEVVDRSDAVINLREDILMNRIRQTTWSGYENTRNTPLAKALAGLQRYCFLLCFTAYINESPDTRFETKFSFWVKERSEIWNQLLHIRRKGPQLYLFRPVDDLRPLSSARPGSVVVNGRSPYSFGQGMFDMIGAGNQSGAVATEMEEFILTARTGVVLTSQTILKVDYWRMSQGEESDEGEVSRLTTPSYSPAQLDLSHESSYFNQNTQRHHTFYIDGASNFRRIKSTSIYGVAQPTVDGLRKVIRRLVADRSRNDKILWINLREEPIIYINGIPYVLRDRYFTLRNIRAYKGITGYRLEQLENRLKEDVIREVLSYDGRILLHGEDTDGNVRPAWEEVDVEDVLTVREVMESVAEEIAQGIDDDESKHVILDYHRIPITAEKAPEWRDFDDLRILLAHMDLSKTSVVLNCQIGLGRSTLGTVIATLLTRWMREANAAEVTQLPGPDRRDRRRYPNYNLINSLLRVIKNGLENKDVVDDTIDKCGVYLNLRDMIESTHIQAENETDESKRKRLLKRGVLALERYFLLICFQAYLDATSPETLDETESFEHWMKRHLEMSTILLELQKDHLELIVPVEKAVGDGVALSSEVMSVVRKRHGQVLAQHTILKHDAFPGCQKMSLKEKVEGAYNFRRVEVKNVKSAVKYGGLAASVGGLAADVERSDDEVFSPPFICGCAMPSKDAIKAVLKAMNAGPGGKRRVLWTCLREEPVLYVNKRPYVLRLFLDPLKNLETTGIAKERVEGMEQRMQLDVLEELKDYEGRLLLHDEEVVEKGGFALVPLWETVPVECVETPAQVFQSIVDEGYQVDYLRIPITDEQAPIPDVFDQLIQRVLDANAGVDILFNCQMGRGRTTTGMVTACLMSMILNNDCAGDMTGSFIVDGVESSAFLYNGEDDESHEERERYQNGEYKIVLQLVSVLTYGKLAKRLTDQAINMCDHMQNLRKAVYDYKLRLDAIEDQGSKKWHTTREVALNYLVRYFYLIVFANYLLEEMGNTHADDESESSNGLLLDEATEEVTICDEEARKITTFKDWLHGRREITNIIKLQSFDLS
ncbi:hypothetical protein EC973_008089 [Apophysomyces ossiformis]|uniref:Paladin n=1 Tax=Apophysomyces ossiformis TaxID=679940 RepID=A0A8H7ER87_9FUNG|nr:hypothetical protein EC973_008089 [Apophysomyces ossiformis]